MTPNTIVLEYAIITVAWLGLLCFSACLTLLFINWIPALLNRLIKDFTPKGMFFALRILITAAWCGKRWKEWCGYEVGTTLAELKSQDPQLWAHIEISMNEWSTTES